MMQPAKQDKYKALEVERTRVVALHQGKLPPQAIDLEEAILGAMLIDARGRDEVLAVLKTADVFYKDAHKAIFSAIQALYNDAKPVDMITVSEWLKAKGLLTEAGGDYYIIQLTQKISSSAHSEYHAYILLQYWMKRQIIKESSQFSALAYDDATDALELVEQWSVAQDNIAQVAFNGRREKSYAEGLREVTERIAFLTNKDPEDISGFSTGFCNADRFTGGWQEGELIVVAARPGMGKTAFALGAALANVKAGVAVGFFSAEMSRYQTVSRTVAQDTNFHLRQITKTGFEKPEYFGTLNEAVRRMEKYPLHIDDAAHPDISHVMTKSRLWKRKHDVKLIIVDYLQLLKDVSVGNNREQEIASISRKLKGLAKELEIPVIALSQLSRAVETRSSNKRPLLSDLRESGAIEQDADAVVFLYRPEYYYGDEWASFVDLEVLSEGGDTELIFAKYRGGAPNTVIALKWIGDKTKYIDPADWHKYERQHEQQQPYEQKPLPTPSASEAFGAQGYSIKDESDNKDVPF